MSVLEQYCFFTNVTIGVFNNVIKEKSPLWLRLLKIPKSIQLQEY